MKKFKSKFFCIATEGATTDGRNITEAWIRQMAETFSQKTYGARVWLEHIRGMLPDSPFKAYGDVIALEARQKEDGKLGLYAQIEPTSDLVQMNKSRQKIYTSIEIDQDFAGTGKAYLIGLGITDSPASLGTDILAFTQKDPEGSFLAARKQNKDNLFSAAEETVIELFEVEEKISFSDRIKEALKPFRRQAERVDGQLDDVLDAVETVASHSAELSGRIDSVVEGQKKYADLETKLDAIGKGLEKFKAEVEGADAGATNRPAATGSDGSLQTDC